MEDYKFVLPIAYIDSDSIYNNLAFYGYLDDINSEEEIENLISDTATEIAKEMVDYINAGSSFKFKFIDIEYVECGIYEIIISCNKQELKDFLNDEDIDDYSLDEPFEIAWNNSSLTWGTLDNIVSDAKDNAYQILFGNGNLYNKLNWRN